jgi:hypothetical protein
MILHCSLHSWIPPQITFIPYCILSCVCLYIIVYYYDASTLRIGVRRQTQWCSPLTASIQHVDTDVSLLTVQTDRQTEQQIAFSSIAFGYDMIWYTLLYKYSADWCGERDQSVTNCLLPLLITLALMFHCSLYGQTPPQIAFSGIAFGLSTYIWYYTYTLQGIDAGRHTKWHNLHNSDMKHVGTDTVKLTAHTDTAPDCVYRYRISGSYDILYYKCMHCGLVRGRETKWYKVLTASIQHVGTDTVKLTAHSDTAPDRIYRYCVWGVYL